VADLGGQMDEREMLSGFLDWNRAVVANKVRGLSRENATRVMTPTGLSPLGVLAHLVAVEYGWFDEKFLGNPDRPDLDAHGDFRVLDDDTVDALLAEYAAACDHARTVVAEASSLDQLSVRASPHYGQVTLRWLLVHMIEETARHAGHLDIMREHIDGATGD
jgi:uncharacterized damage-inducible protein DinB